MLCQNSAESQFEYVDPSLDAPHTIADTITVARIDAVQAEYSAFETLHETDGLIDTARELDIAYVAYSPLGHGWLVDDFPYKTPDDFAADDFRRTGKARNPLPTHSSAAKTSRSPQIPRPELLRQQENRRADQDSSPAQGMHFDASGFGVGDGAGHDPHPRNDQAASSGRELCVEGCGVDGGREGGDA